MRNPCRSNDPKWTQKTSIAISRAEKTFSLTVEHVENFFKADSASHAYSAKEKNRLKSGYLKENHEIIEKMKIFEKIKTH